MYGLLIENIIQYIQDNFGVDKWNEIRRQAQIEETSFHTHTVYPDVYTKNIIDKACKTLRISEKQLLLGIGESFVTFIGRYGYDVVLSALAIRREFSDFLNSLDDLHEYLRLSYPRLKPPSYFCDNENEYGLILHYRTKRNFLLWYTVGQILKVAKLFYSTDVEVELLSENQEINEYHFILQLHFDNRVYLERLRNGIGEHQHHSNHHGSLSSRCLSRLSINSPLLYTNNFNNNNNNNNNDSSNSREKLFMDIFPFNIVFDSNMKICQIGSCLKMVCPNILGQNLTKVFSLIKPKIDFNWESILRHTNTTFELKLDILLKSGNNSSRIIRELRNNSRSNLADYEMMNRSDVEIAREVKYREEYGQLPNHVTVLNDSSPVGDNNQSFLKLKGQMIYFDCWKCISFLGAPNVANLDTLIKTGLYLNDLSMHDFSRDMVLAGQQQSAELKLALDQELRKSRQLEITIRKLDEERLDLLPINYVLYFASVTILFSDIINFTEICSKIAPMDVVNMLNETYTCFDRLTEKHDIYKVETVGDAYMIAGGLPVHQEESSYNHARKVCLAARDMIHACYQIRDPSRGRHIKIRIGIHTGPVVGGIVGQKMPRYCLFGDTVNTSSRLETTSAKMKIQISEVTQRLLDPNEWIIRERGTIRLKGKGMMKTYWLEYRKDRMNKNQLDGRLKNPSDNDDDISDVEQQKIDPNFDPLNLQSGGGGEQNKQSTNQNILDDSNYSLFIETNRFKWPCLII
ncbi:hypothetical protein DERP_005166 [Dermatophagoides pteronyssinus]|uniref:guanylate cyclase n=1 Tax=Dermatophagoides pteronyssinus TaxID=6956 RepID=A0ABQ8JLU3_DERPT|nr:hypothetical protein DERP_005166 [Dermatophagoides pteronyssinus]